MKESSVIVKYRTVSLTLFQWSPRPGVTYWKFRHGKKHVVRADFKKAHDEAKRIVEETYLGSARLGMLAPAQTKGIRKILEVDPQLSLVDEFLQWHTSRKPRKNCTEAAAEFIAALQYNGAKFTIEKTFNSISITIQ